MSNYDEILDKLDAEIDAMRAHYKGEQKRLSDKLDSLIYEHTSKTTTSAASSVKPPTSTATSTTDTSKTEKKYRTAKLTRPPIAAPQKIDFKEMDRQLGVFYGCVELRDAVKDAQQRMDSVLGVLQRVKVFVHSPFVNTEIDNMFANVKTLQQIFHRMVNNMEIPDGDAFFEQEGELE